ncbi:MAG: hypothetical protein H7099_20105 [Gemmatimonadaceae bacterium]|nr:hypothetical protein [Gemmatimonadaceae bacterium]
MDVSTQQLLIRFAGTLNRRRAYSPAHPIVVAAEQQLLASIGDALRARSTMSIGVARNELIVDGELWELKNGIARELANRLHRRGVGAITLEAGLALDDLQSSLAWLVLEPGAVNDVPPNAGGFHITRTAYDLLILDDAIRDAQSAIASLWRTLAEVTGIFADRHEQSAREAAMAEEYAGLPLMFDDAPSGDHGFDTDAILEALTTTLADPSVARRTAVALLELTNHGVATTREGKALIGEQMLTLLERLGQSSLGPIVKGLVDGSKQQEFVSGVVEVLPVAEAVTWLEAAAAASEQQISHQLVRLMSKLSTVADDRGDEGTETAFRDAAREIVSNWSLPDPNPAEHVELLDRIAAFERTSKGGPPRRTDRSGSTIESSRLVQMALELEMVGEDTVAAVEALVAAGESRTMMAWITAAGTLPVARELRAVMTSPRVVRQLLLTEPVDRLQARALLDELDVDSADTLLDVLGEASSKGTRLLVRQRLAEFGDAITPRLVARLTDGPWYLIRNVLSLLVEMSTADGEGGGSMDALVSLQGHAQVQVRIEALRVLVRMNEDTRTAAFGRALADDNERVLVMALQELTESSAERGTVPDALVSQIMALVDSGKPSEPVRARAIRALMHTRSDGVRDWLINIVSKRSPILRQLLLVEPSLPAVSALYVLTRVYADDPAARGVHAVAVKVAKDPRWQVRDTGSSAERAT